MPCISFEVDAGMLAQIDKAVKSIGNTDRSKFIRSTLLDRLKVVNVASEARSIGSIPRGRRVRSTRSRQGGDPDGGQEQERRFAAT